MKKIFENRTIWFYLFLSTALINISILLIGLISPGFALKTFDISVVISLAFAIISVIIPIVFDYKFLLLLVSLANGIVLGLIAYWGSPIIADLINNINFLDGNSTIVIIQLSLSIIACVIAVLSNFKGLKKEDNDEKN